MLLAKSYTGRDEPLLHAFITVCNLSELLGRPAVHEYGAEEGHHYI